MAVVVETRPKSVIVLLRLTKISPYKDISRRNLKCLSVCGGENWLMEYLGNRWPVMAWFTISASFFHLILNLMRPYAIQVTNFLIMYKISEGLTSPSPLVGARGHIPNYRCWTILRKLQLFGLKLV